MPKAGIRQESQRNEKQDKDHTSKKQLAERGDRLGIWYHFLYHSKVLHTNAHTIIHSPSEKKIIKDGSLALHFPFRFYKK